MGAVIEGAAVTVSELTTAADIVGLKDKLKEHAIDEGLFEVADWMDDAAAIIEKLTAELKKAPGAIAPDIKGGDNG